MKPVLLFLLAAATSVSAGDPRDLVRRSLPFLKEQGLAWIEERECTSCHQVPAMLWSLNAAAAAGLDPEGTEVAEWTPWAADWRHWNQTGDKDGEEKVTSGNIDTMSALLLSRNRESQADPAWVVEFRDWLLKHRQPDGSWKAGGQLPLGKRPARETTEVTTMWALLALDSTDGSVPPEVRQNAGSFLASAANGQSTEWHALRLLLDPGKAARKTELLDLQHDDGGWGWLAAEPSDAFGTGLALYALSRAGMKEDDPARQKALAFLTSTQAENGSWPVPSTRKKDGNKINRTATYWGTAWVVVGILERYGTGPTANP